MNRELIISVMIGGTMALLIALALLTGTPEPEPDTDEGVGNMTASAELDAAWRHWERMGYHAGELESWYRETSDDDRDTALSSLFPFWYDFDGWSRFNADG